MQSNTHTPPYANSQNSDLASRENCNTKRRISTSPALEQKKRKITHQNDSNNAATEPATSKDIINDKSLVITSNDEVFKHPGDCYYLKDNHQKFVGSAPRKVQHGNVYQLELTMLCLWRLYKQIEAAKYKQFQFAGDIAEVMKFDDIVLQYKEPQDTQWRVRLLQAKHQEKINKEDRLDPIEDNNLINDHGDFSIPQYFNAFLNFQQKIDTDTRSRFCKNKIQDLILITNKIYHDPPSHSDFKIMEDHLERIADDILLKTETGNVKILRISNSGPARSKLQLICENTSDFYQLIKSLADHICNGKKITKNGIFAKYSDVIVHILESSKPEASNAKAQKDNTDTTRCANIKDVLITELSFRNANNITIQVDQNYQSNNKACLPSDRTKLEKLAKQVAQHILTNKVLNIDVFKNNMNNLNVLVSQVIDTATQKFYKNFQNNETLSPELEVFRRLLINELYNNQSGATNIKPFQKQDLQQYNMQYSQGFDAKKSTASENIIVPRPYSEEDFDQFCTQFKLITNYNDRDQLSDVLKNEIKLNELVQPNSEAQYTMYYNALHKWCTDRVGQIYEHQEAKKLFDKINDNMQIPVLYGMSQTYFASPFVKEDINVGASVITQFLSTKNHRVLYLVCDNITLGHIILVKKFQQLVKSKNEEIKTYIPLVNEKLLIVR